MSGFCQNCGSEIKQGIKFCMRCGFAVDKMQPLAPHGTVSSAQPATAYQQPQHTNIRPPKKRNRRLVAIIAVAACALAAILVVLFMIAPMLFGQQAPGTFGTGVRPSAIAITGDESENGIVTSKAVFELEEKMSPGGGVITISNESSMINGFSIDVAEDSFEEDTDFSISAAAVLSHGFEPDLVIISPLINIDNGENYSQELIMVTMPCVVPKDVIPVAFYYHDEDKSLEYIPVMDFNEQSITVGVKHFSDLVFGYFENKYIDDAVSVDTGFLPGVDDFSFVNYGSAITQRGNCFGESIASIWYYNNQKKSQGSLYGRFDNFGKNPDFDFETKAFQFDDVMAYRLASMSQYLFAVSPATTQTDWDVSRWNAMRTSDQVRFDQLVALMKFKGPQVLLIQRVDENKVMHNFHAVIAYRVDRNRIYVADPNKPGQRDRYIEIENGRFKPYSSADNAQDLEAGNAVNYNVFSAFGETSMFDQNRMRQLWQELNDRTVGDDQFPKVDIKLIAKVKNAQGDEEDEEIVEGYRAKGNSLNFVVEGPGDINWAVYQNKQNGEVVRVQPANGRYTVQVDKDGLYIGIRLFKNNKWYGFEWYGIEYSDISGVYDVAGNVDSDWGGYPLTPFQARIEQNGAAVQITFLDHSGISLKGTYDESSRTFIGRDPRPPGGDTLEAALATTWWQLADTVIVFEIGTDSITAAGKLVAQASEGDFLPTHRIEITLNKVADLD